MSAFGSPISSLSHAFDSLPSTEFAACTVQMDVGAFTAAVISKIRFFPKMGDYGVFANSVFSAANSASGPWNTLLTVGAAESVTDGWNVFELEFPRNSLAGHSPSIATCAGRLQLDRVAKPWSSSSSACL